MVANDLHEGVRDARVVDVVSAVSAAAAVETPTIVDLTNPEHASMRTPLRFGVGDLLAGVLGDLASLFKSDGGETAFAVNGRRLDC